VDPPSANALTGFFQHSFLEDLVRLQHAWILFVKRVLLLANAVMILDAPNFWISFITALLHIFQTFGSVQLGWLNVPGGDRSVFNLFINIFDNYPPLIVEYCHEWRVFQSVLFSNQIFPRSTFL